MGTTFTVTVGSTRYEVVEDVESLFDAVASGVVKDDVTLRPPLTDVARDDAYRERSIVGVVEYRDGRVIDVIRRV